MPHAPDAPYRPFNEAGADDTFGEVNGRGSALRLRCWDCDHIVQMGGPVLVERFGPGCTIRKLAGRPKCGECGSMRVVLYAVNGHSAPDRPGLDAAG